MEVDEVSYNVMLYDTAGQEEYDKLRIEYLKNKKPDVLILCYAIDSLVTYVNVRAKWIPELKNRAPIVLVGTKSDLRKRRDKTNIISYKKGVALKNKIKAFSYVECSARDLKNIDAVFEEAVRAAIGKKSVDSDGFLQRVKIYGKTFFFCLFIISKKTFDNIFIAVLKLFCMY